MSQSQFYDRHWKSLPDAVVIALLRTIFPGFSGTLDPWKTELAVPIPLRADNVFLILLDGVLILLHLEYQSTLDATMPERIYHYDSDLDRLARAQFGHPVAILSVVVWTCAGSTPAPVYHVEVAGKTIAHKEYYEIHLTEMQPQLAGDPQLLVLAPYFKTVQAADLVPIARDLYRNSTPEQRDQLLAALIALGQYKFGEISEVIAAIMKEVGKTMDEFMEAFRQSDFGVAVLAQGEARGKAEGEAQGIAKGEQEARRHIISRLWQKRFAQDIGDAERAQLAALPIARFDALIEALVDGILTAEQVLAQFAA